MSDTTMVVVFASQKGGSGKTTLAGHVAVEAEKCGAGPVAIIDTDPQGSLAKWWNARASQTPAFVQTTIPNLGRDIEQLHRDGIRLVIVDTPPSVTSSIVDVVTHADLVIVPTRPSPHDLRAVGATVDIVEHQHKPLVFVVNSATMRARITSETAVALSQHGTVAPGAIHHRVDFAASMIDGRTVGEVDAESRSAREISDLWTYLDGRLKRLRDGPIGARMSNDPARELETLTPYRGGEDIEYDEENAAPVVAVPTPAAVPATPVVPVATGTWDGVDRRKRDAGPPPNMPERRASAVFGRRNAG